jgi:MYXO-CTERM domain-containing protein
VLATAALFALTSSAAAQVLTNYNGDTTGLPTWQNPFSNNPAVYEPREFHVTDSGTYTFHVDWSYDGYLFLYDQAFDPNDWTRNFVESNDDFNDVFQSEITRNMTRGLTYVMVHSAYGLSGYGPYDMLITGPVAGSGIVFGPAPGGSTTGGSGGTGTGGAGTGGTGTGGTSGGTGTGGTGTGGTGTTGTSGTGSGTGSGSGAGSGTVGLPPNLSSVTPDSGLAQGGTAVVILGSGFTGATFVSFGPRRASNLSVVSDTEIRCTTPSGNGTVPVHVGTPAGVNAQPLIFTYFGVANTKSSGSSGSACALGTGSPQPTALLPFALLALAALLRRRHTL